jgi:hypothetical protein
MGGRLAEEKEANVLAFLTMRPIHTAIMSGLIRDNGIVSPLNRGEVYAYRGMSQLGRELLTKTESITVLVNERAPQAHAFYRRAGYQFSGHYDTIYFRR